MNEKILLNKSKSKVSTNYNNSLTIQLNGSKRILPCDPMETSISEIDVYNKEREDCSKIRLTVQINPICSNVLFNNLTEIVKNEGTDKTIWVNHGEGYMADLNNLVGKSVFFKKVNGEDGFYNGTGSGNLNSVNAIRDTQLSSIANGYKYHCGLDIFNNHLLRSKTFKVVCPRLNGENKWFNTLFDEKRSYKGEIMKGYKDKVSASKMPDMNLHLYMGEEVLSYNETVSQKLIEKNGWFGFTNVGKLKVYDDSENNKKEYDWFKVINDRKPCDFIDMYPNRELFFFDPLYNHNRQRIEKNWLYCITYPSSSTTDVSFIKTYENKTTGLKVILFDDTIKYKNGIDAIKIWSISKHGLSKDDNVNIYKSIKNVSGETQDICILRNVRVLDVVDEYTFYVFGDGVKISNKWIELPEKIDGSYEGYSISSDRKYLYNGDKKYYLINYKKANVDDDAQDISFKRVVDNKETSYYVRIFSKLPNWKFAPKKPTEELIENDKVKPYDESDIRKYQTTENDFDNHIGKLAFSKNIYTDNITEIVFTDDIDISSLRDNLGRPISEIFLTIIKINAGYREWYGKERVGNEQCVVTDPIIEYSHCFGKVNCAFKLSNESIPNNEHKNVLLINNVDNLYHKQGLDITQINDRNSTYIEDDEIQYEPYSGYNGDYSFYGDLCCYSEEMCEEQSIQMVDFRFNTAQRELTNSYDAFNFINDITYDEISSDDYDDNGFKEKTEKFNNSAIRKEGYYYKPHYKITIKTYDNELTTVYPSFLDLKSINSISDGKYTITTMGNHNLGLNDIVNVLYKEPYVDEQGVKKNKIEHYFGKVSKIYEGNTKVFDVDLFSDDLLTEKANIYTNNKRYIKLFVKTENTPSYASLLKDGSCRYVYRNLYQNGFNEEAEVETYPFTNGSLYVNKNITFFVRRQNPKGENELRSKTYPFDITSNGISFEKENKYYHEEEIEC